MSGNALSGVASCAARDRLLVRCVALSRFLAALRFVARPSRNADSGPAGILSEQIETPSNSDSP